MIFETTEYRVWVTVGHERVTVPISRPFGTEREARRWARQLNSDEWRIEEEDVNP